MKFSSKASLEEIYECEKCGLNIHCYDASIMSIEFKSHDRFYTILLYSKDVYSIHNQKYEKINCLDFELKNFKLIANKIVKIFRLSVFS